jgi:hypothetical protein
MKLGLNIETNCRALTPRMNVSYVVHHKGMASLVSKCIASILCILLLGAEMLSAVPHIKQKVQD